MFFWSQLVRKIFCFDFPVVSVHYEIFPDVLVYSIQQTMHCSGDLVIASIYQDDMLFRCSRRLNPPIIYICPMFSLWLKFLDVALSIQQLDVTFRLYFALMFALLNFESVDQKNIGTKIYLMNGTYIGRNVSCSCGLISCGWYFVPMFLLWSQFIVNMHCSDFLLLVLIHYAIILVVVCSSPGRYIVSDNLLVV